MYYFCNTKDKNKTEKPHKQRRGTDRRSETLTQISSLVVLCTWELCRDFLTSWRGQRQL